MEQKEIIEGNKLIAEFMGVLKKDGDHLHLWVKKVEDLIGEPVPTDICELCLKFKYHSSWDWLMPVVEKIIKLNINIGKRKHYTPAGSSIEFHFMGVDDFKTIMWNETGWHSVIKGINPIDTVFISVIRFIKWYNQTHP